MEKFYVYGHYKPDSDIPFYIGKGCRNRAFIKSNRGKYWKRIVAKYGYRVEIMYDNLSESMALMLERETRIANPTLKNIRNI